MAKPPIPPTRDSSGYIKTKSGLLVPPGAASSGGMARGEPTQHKRVMRIAGIEDWNQINHAGFSYGLHLIRDDKTLIVRWPKKGSGVDDLVNGAIADGTLANAGIAPVVFPQVPGILARQISQAATAALNLTGKRSPTYKARAAISRFNDSPLGITQAIRQIVYQLRTYNRGAPIATVPLTYRFEEWEQMGLTAVPFSEGDNRYFLQVDWATHGVPVPFLPSVFDLEATGDNQWPYWYRTMIDDQESWVLLHNSHIVSLLPSHSQAAGVGTSAVYMLCHILADHILDLDTRVERKISALTDGLVGISGIQQGPDEVIAMIEQDDELRRGDGIMLSRGYTVLTAPEGKIEFDMLSFRQDDGIAYQERREFYEDVLALAFEEFLGAVVTRGGIGYGVQADTNRAAAADAGVEAMLRMIEVALGSIYPRVQISLTRPNDAIKRENLENLQTFAGAVQSLPEGTFSTEEIRTIINRDILDIPEVTTETVSTDADASDTTDKNDGPGSDDNSQDEPKESADDSDAEMAALSLVIYPFVTITEALRTPESERLYKTIMAGLLAQYRAADIASVVAEVRARNIDPAKPDANDLIAEIVSRHMPRLREVSDLALILSLLQIFAAMGRQEAERHGEAAGVGMDDNDRRVLDNRSRAFLSQRVKELYTEATGVAGDDDHADIEDPTMPQTLDATSDKIMALFIRNGLMAVDDDKVAGYVAERIPASAAWRADFIAEYEGGRGHGYGMITAGRQMGALRKEWLMTLTPPPNQREDHLLSVGEVVEYEQRFSNGDKWSQERPRCRCGIRLHFS